ncbi:hypothetical protein DERF_008179 [Dermatophagoides farinae]|uniref:Uncharacterized protein n=1 Tax=Dermatophagoides farinae TaxID=6954 RepID=A0A922HZS1_DERFA|nr:hypothetical protein DERF_008179 [Dermatophagoides farinae]
MFIVKKVYGLTPRTAHLLLNVYFCYNHVWLPRMERITQFQYMERELPSFVALSAITNTPPLELHIEYVANVTLARITGKYRHDDDEIILDKCCYGIGSASGYFDGQLIIRQRTDFQHFVQFLQAICISFIWQSIGSSRTIITHGITIISTIWGNNAYYHNRKNRIAKSIIESTN